REDGNCGPFFECTPCNPGRCCTRSGKCADNSDQDLCGQYNCYCQCNSVEMCLGCPIISNGIGLANNGTDTTTSFSGVTCSTYHASLSAGGDDQGVFCRRLQGVGGGGDGGGACGQCLKVKNRKAGTQTTIRMADCSKEDSKLGKKIFDELDINGQGRAQGYLNVDYQVVHCDNH
ncbi:Pathogenesis-related protein PR-4B, partial [Linum grandiflorum]